MSMFNISRQGFAQSARLIGGYELKKGAQVSIHGDMFVIESADALSVRMTALPNSRIARKLKSQPSAFEFRQSAELIAA